MAKTAHDSAIALPELIPGRWTAPGTAVRYRAAGDVEHMSFRTLQARGRVAGTMAPGEDFTVQWLLAGDGVIDAGRGAKPFSTRRPLLLPPDRPCSVELFDPDQRFVHLRRSFVESVAAERYLFRSGALPVAHHVLPDDAAVEQWWAAVAAAYQHTRAGAVDADQWAALARTVAEALLELYPPAAPELPEPLREPRNARLRAVVEFAHKHAQSPLVLADLAAVAELSPRALQQGFQRVLGLSPMAYLRQARLEHVRTDLLAATPDDASVGEIARRWGFAHLGRFAAAYADRFGEYPHTSLRS